LATKADKKICEDCKTRQKKTALTFRESEVVGKQTGYVKSFFSPLERFQTPMMTAIRKKKKRNSEDKIQGTATQLSPSLWNEL